MLMNKTVMNDPALEKCFALMQTLIEYRDDLISNKLQKIRHKHSMLHLDVLVIPAGVKHRFTNRGNKPAVTFNVYSPPAYPAGAKGWAASSRGKSAGTAMPPNFV